MPFIEGTTQGNGGSGCVLEHPIFVTHGNEAKICGTKLGWSGWSVWVGFGTRRWRILGFRPNIDLLGLPHTIHTADAKQKILILWFTSWFDFAVAECIQIVQV